MTNAHVIARKLAHLAEYAARARKRRPGSADEFASDIDVQDALGMALLVAIQEAIDLSFHIVTDQRWGTPGSYAEGFELLQKHSLISPELTQAMIRATGLRNRLAHGYASVDVMRLWGELPAGLDALDEFARAIAAFLDRAGE